MRLETIDANWAEKCANDADDTEWFGKTTDSEESFERYQQCAAK